MFGILLNVDFQFQINILSQECSWPELTNAGPGNAAPTGNGGNRNAAEELRAAPFLPEAALAKPASLQASIEFPNAALSRTPLGLFGDCEDVCADPTGSSV